MYKLTAITRHASSIHAPVIAMATTNPVRTRSTPTADFYC
jgi:hypothetical protein